MFTSEDLQQIARHGLTPEAVERQIADFRRGFPFLKVVRAASPGDGVAVLDEAQADAAVARYEQAVGERSVVKFVPASGAATRMFKELFEFVNEDKRGKGIDTLLQNIERFAFCPELKAVLPAGADERAVVAAIVGEGLAYGSKPKGLVTFHAYPDGARKAVEEHLVEGAAYAASGGVARIHFTVSPEHRAGFEALLAEKIPVYEKRFGIRYAFGALGWFLILLACVVAGGLPMLNPAWAVPGFGTSSVAFYVVLGVGAFLMLFLNTPGRNPLVNVGSGVWNLYNNITGLLSDVLSYIRLFAIGLSGGVLALVFNSLAEGFVPEGANIAVRILIMLPILLIGHGINLFMSTISSFVHPMRLTFVEFYKNAGFEMATRNFEPLRKMEN